MDSAMLESLRGFCRELGNGDRTAQLKLCDRYIGILGARADKLAGEHARRCRLIMTLCICGAAGVAVILF